MCELIVGRWYDFRQEGNEDEIAGKWEGTIHNEYFYMTAGLRKRGGYYKITKGSWWMPKKIKPCLLTCFAIPRTKSHQPGALLSQHSN